jgi:hypothetical protein
MSEHILKQPRRCLLDNRAVKKIHESYDADRSTSALNPIEKSIIEQAEKDLLEGPWSVVLNKKHMPPDKIDPYGLNLYNNGHPTYEIPPPSVHDFVSLSIYLWPDPEKPDGLPYVSRGAVNPESDEYDREPLRKMCEAVESLTMAWFISSEEKYAEKATTILRHFFLEEATAMAPHMMYAQHIPSNGEVPSTFYMPRLVGWRDSIPFYVSYGGMIEGTHFVTLVENIKRLRASAAWTDDDDSAMQHWFRQFLAWMRESQIGVDESVALNNHASWYYAQAAAYADYIGDDDFLDAVIKRHVPARIALQIEPDGSMPAELGRHIAWRYATFTLTSFFNSAIVAERHGVDLWNYQTSDGRGLRATLDWMADRIAGEKEIEGSNVEGIQHLPVVPLLAIGAQKYDEPRYASLLENLPGYPEDHPYRLLFAV